MEEKIFEELIETKETKLEDILSNLINKQDLELKTEIHNPLVISALDVLAISLRENNLNISSNILANFLYWFRINMVSYKRLSRNEIIKGIIGLREEAIEERKSLIDKLLKLK
jgi:pantothenate synthetase